MKHTGMPVFRLTEDSIWRSFHSSSKRHIILTGARGSGKTTLLGQLFPQRIPGITTWAIPKKGVFLRENISGKTVQIGVYDPGLPGPGNQMTPVLGGFTDLGIPALKACIHREEQWITVDEIGYLEASCPAYQQELWALMEKKQVAAAVRKQDLPFLHQLCSREDVFVVDLDDPFGNLGCVIMASGLGKRFGGNKLMADFHGTPMIQRILTATECVFSRRVVVTRHKEVAQLCEQLGVRALLHDLPHRSDTVRLGVEAMQDMTGCMFCPSDQPLLHRDSVAALALAAINQPEYIWQASHGDIHGAPVVFPQWAFEELRHLPEGKGGSVIIKKYPERLRTVSVRDLYQLKDVDCPQDLKELLER